MNEPAVFATGTNMEMTIRLSAGATSVSAIALGGVEGIMMSHRQLAPDDSETKVA
jgi:hypothetical protein